MGTTGFDSKSSPRALILFDKVRRSRATYNNRRNLRIKHITQVINHLGAVASVAELVVDNQ